MQNERRDMTTEQQNPNWRILLNEAITKPGIISQAYSKFWRYSTHNQLLALYQCLLRRLEPGPINTYAGWLAMGRQVQRGQKALVLCQPITYRQNTFTQAQDTVEAERTVMKGFVYKPRWFVLAQTSGDPVPEEPIPFWDKAKALAALGINQIAFDEVNGNIQGYATGNNISISPLAEHPQKTLMHELAHQVLGHTKEHNTSLSKALVEIEAECVAYLVGSVLNFGHQDESRGYIQHWLQHSGQDAIPEANAHRILKATNTILVAGRQDQTPEIL
jgi:hypothetical protein